MKLHGDRYFLRSCRAVIVKTDQLQVLVSLAGELQRQVVKGFSVCCCNRYEQPAIAGKSGCGAGGLPRLTMCDTLVAWEIGQIQGAVLVSPKICRPGTAEKEIPGVIHQWHDGVAGFEGGNDAPIAGSMDSAVSHPPAVAGPAGKFIAGCGLSAECNCSIVAALKAASFADARYGVVGDQLD